MPIKREYKQETLERKTAERAKAKDRQQRLIERLRAKVESDPTNPLWQALLDVTLNNP